MFPPLLTRQELREIGKHDGEGAPNTEEKKQHIGKMRVFNVFVVRIECLMWEGHTHRWAAQE